MKGLGPSLLRLAVGTVFVAHGLVKLLPVSGGGVSETVALFESLAFRAPYAVALTLGWVEVAGGVALVLGAYIGWTAFALLLTTAVTGWKLHLPHGLFLNWSLEPGVGHGYEFDLLLIGALLSLIVTGAGSLSVDHARQSAAELKAAGLARLRRG
jgi:putative oxidoreductase